MGLLRTTTALGVFALLACGPKNPAPHSVPNEIRAGAAGMTEDAGVPAREMGATSSTPTTPAQEPLLPSQFGDPPPLKSAKQWLFDFEFESSRAAGENIRLLSTSEALLETPRETPRVMGRFALELWEKDRLLERARFDFPLLAMTPDAKPLTKLFALLFFFIWVRWTYPRLRYDQLMGFGWKVLLPASVVNVMIAAVWLYWRANA